MMFPQFRNVFGAFAVVVLAMSVLAGASRAGEIVNKDWTDIAIRGYDPVAYFTEGRPVPGKRAFEHVWHDAKWRFASAEHRDMFAREPGRYAPRYGGFCAGAMAQGQKASIDPEAWVIIDGKLYLSFAKSFIREFAKNSSDRIPKADSNWERLGYTN